MRPIAETFVYRGEKAFAGLAQISERILVRLAHPREKGKAIPAPRKDNVLQFPSGQGNLDSITKHIPPRGY